MLKTPFTSEYRQLLDGLIRSREDKGLSQRQLAEQLGVPQSAISKIEVGERRLDMVEFIVISRALGSRPADIGDRISSIAEQSTLTSLA